MSDKVTIQKAKITSDFCLEVEFTEPLPGHAVKDTKLSCTVPVHDDLRNQFKNLTKHLALAADQIKGKVKDIDKWEPEELVDFTVKGYNKSGSEGESIGITGAYDGKYGTVNINTPKIRTDKSDYPFVSELGLVIEACDYEVKEYLFNGKRAPEQRMSMDLGEAPEPPVSE